MLQNTKKDIEGMGKQDIFQYPFITVGENTDNNKSELTVNNLFSPIVNTATGYQENIFSN